MTRGRWVGAAVAAGLVGLVVVVLVLAAGDDRPRSTTGLDLSALGPQGSELVRLLRQGKTETFHARYRATSPPGDEDAQEVSMELWQKPPRQRHDLVVTAGGQQGRSSGFILGNRTVSCVEQNSGGAWSCQDVEENAVGGPDAFLRQLTSEVAGGALDARDDTIAGSPVRCFHFPLPAETADVCVTRRGIVARISAGPSKIELVELGSIVPDQIFSLPARGGG